MKKVLLLALSAGLIFTSCKKEDPTLSLNMSGLEDLGPGYAYEGWVMIDGSPVSTGTFTVDANGNLSQTEFMVGDDADLESATRFVLSIEPVPDSDPAPSAVKYLAGDFSGDVAAVNTDIVANLDDATGSYFLATPTTNDMTDEASGVWFIDGGAAGLSLPTLAEGWVYEGWAVIDGTPVSTGTFLDETTADATNPFSGSDNPAPPYPGEDFIMNAPAGLSFPTDLTGMPIVVSIEPNPDNSTAPFALKPLSAAAMATGNTTMNNNAAGFPTGSVTRNIE